MKSTRVEVRMLNIPRWHGLSGSRSIAQDFRIRATISPETGRYMTGLNEKDIQWLKEQGVKDDLSDTTVSGEPHPFWDSKLGSVMLTREPRILNLANPYEFIQYKIMLDSPFVANSLEDFEKGLCPNATHYIHDVNEENQRKADMIAVRRDVQSKLREAKLSQKVDVLMAMGIDARGSGYDQNAIEIAIDDKAEKEPKEVLFYLTMKPKDLAMRSMILRALQQHVLEQESAGIRYEQVILGSSMEEVMITLDKPEYSEMLVRIQSQLN